MRVVRYVGAGEDLPLLAKGNASVLETDDHAFHGPYHAVVRGLFLTALAASTLAAQINPNSLGDDVPTLKAGNAAVLEVDDHAFASGYRAVTAALQRQAAQTQRLTALIAPYSIGDNVPVLSQQAAPALELDDAGYVFVPSPAKAFIVTPPDEDFPFVGSLDDSGFGWIVVPDRSTYVRPNIGEDDFPGTRVYDEDGPPATRFATVAVSLPNAIEEDFPIAPPVGVTPLDEEGFSTWRTSVARTPIGPTIDEDVPSLAAAPPTLAVPEDELPALVMTAQPRIVFVSTVDEEFPLPQPTGVFEDDVQPWWPRLALASLQQPQTEEDWPTSLVVEDDVQSIVPVVARQVWPAPIHDEFPLLVTPTIAFEEDAPIPRVPVLPLPFRGTVGDDSAFMVGIPTVTPLTGKYKPEHDSALVDLGSAQGFQTEHDSALTDISNAQGFSSEHASALKDLGDAGI